MFAQTGQSRPESGQMTGNAPDPRPVVLAQRPGNAVKKPDVRPFAAIVEQSGDKQVLVRLAP